MKSKEDPVCSLFNDCRGCSYQDIPYEDELSIKEKELKDLINELLEVDPDCFEPIVPSPKPYHYRNRLDLKLLKTKSKEVFIGFTPKSRHGVIPIESCYIAREEISSFIPELKKQAIDKLPENYRLANLVVRSGEDGRVFWGGIGKKSLLQEEGDFFWVEIEGKKIFYSLDTFFQANISILPSVFQKIKSLGIWGNDVVFYDLYGGVGLFGVGMVDSVSKVVLIEESIPSLRLAKYNVEYHDLKNFKIIEGRVEDHFLDMVNEEENGKRVAMIDPPRAGLSQSALDLLVSAKGIGWMLYLSCNPKTLARDLGRFVANNWNIEKIIPFDFFPKTAHLETLVLLKKFNCGEICY
ncbi:MAG: hypothetical protein KKD07_09400 [Candidatus Omnitrophica bacterium]|nr:hypothetical protein [Candidatus Omnitrophota bacterium]MBU4334642.1 hypothetical protein [Candidatus Omnitrophota bacterium]